MASRLHETLVFKKNGETISLRENRFQHPQKKMVTKLGHEAVKIGAKIGAGSLKNWGRRLRKLGQTASEIGARAIENWGT